MRTLKMSAVEAAVAVQDFKSFFNQLLTTGETTIVEALKSDGQVVTTATINMTNNSVVARARKNQDPFEARSCILLAMELRAILALINSGGVETDEIKEYRQRVKDFDENFFVPLLDEDFQCSKELIAEGLELIKILQQEYLKSKRADVNFVRIQTAKIVAESKEFDTLRVYDACLKPYGIKVEFNDD
ncbi:hypothetical protein [Caudoviricetes sp.]|nr:hypothetical protein [Caudoviricetes sp.]